MIDCTWSHIHRLSSIQPHRVHPSAFARTVGVRCVSPSLPSHMHVSFVHRTHVTHLFPSCRPVMYARVGHRLTRFIGPWPCTARIACCPPAGLIPRYRLDEFMSEVIIFPCSKLLSGGSQAHWLVLASHWFLFFFFFPFQLSPFGTLKGCELISTKRSKGAHFPLSVTKQ